MSDINLRERKGNKGGWTLEQLKAGLEKFHAQHGRYPTALEVDRYLYLPTSRSIQRKFGGLIAARKLVGLDGQDDFRSGEYSSKRAHTINQRNDRLEMKVYHFLSEKFGEKFVHREYFFTDDRRSRIDFFIYHKEGQFLVDTFYPSDKHNFSGCLNNKLRIYDCEFVKDKTVIFLQMNENLPQEAIDKLVSNKKNRLKSNQKVMCYEEFVKYCQKLQPFKAI